MVTSVADHSLYQETVKNLSNPSAPSPSFKHFCFPCLYKITFPGNSVPLDQFLQKLSQTLDCLHLGIWESRSTYIVHVYRCTLLHGDVGILLLFPDNWYHALEQQHLAHELGSAPNSLFPLCKSTLYLICHLIDKQFCRSFGIF